MKIFDNLILQIGFPKHRPQLALIDFTLTYFLLAPESYFNRFTFIKSSWSKIGIKSEKKYNFFQFLRF